MKEPQGEDELRITHVCGHSTGDGSHTGTYTSEDVCEITCRGRKPVVIRGHLAPIPGFHTII